MSIRYDEISIAVPILAIFFWIENNVDFIFLSQFFKFLYICAFRDSMFFG